MSGNVLRENAQMSKFRRIWSHRSFDTISACTESAFEIKDAAFGSNKKTGKRFHRF
jgi:hypothetical protein